MKKIRAAVSALSLALAFPVAVPTVAAAQGQDPGSADDQVARCKAFFEAVPDSPLNLGDCVGFFRADPEAFPAQYCGSLQDRGLLDDHGFRNVGECIQFMFSLGH